MERIEKMLTGALEMRDFLALLLEDDGLQAACNALVPAEAVDQPEHPFWKIIYYPSMKEKAFDMMAFLAWLRGFSGTIGGNLVVFDVLSRAYCYHYPQTRCTSRYKEAHGVYLDAAGEYIGGPEVQKLIEEIVYGALRLPTRGQRVQYAKELIRLQFHITSRSRPHWIREARWPMGENSPMAYIGRKKCGDGAIFQFRDVDTGEIRDVVQYY